MQRQQKITLREMRDSGPTRLIVYCADYRCAHSVTIDADRWADGVWLSDLEPKFTCQACGKRGAGQGRYLNPPAWGQVRNRPTWRARWRDLISTKSCDWMVPGLGSPINAKSWGGDARRRAGWLRRVPRRSRRTPRKPIRWSERRSASRLLKKSLAKRFGS